jgi:branched-chain amino acid transport system ATP-binding protein
MSSVAQPSMRFPSKAMALGLARHAFLLETGRIAMRGAADELRADATVRHAYLGY